MNLSSTKLMALYWIGVLAPGVFMFTALLLGWPKPWSPVFTWIGPLISVVVVATISATPWRRAAYLVLIPVVVVFGLALGTIAPTWFMPPMMVHPN